jgi:hypothetical protein
MLHDKQFYRDLNPPNGYKWGGAGDLPYTHFFQSGRKVLECSEICLSNGDLEFLATNDMTCDKSRLKALSKECIKKYGKV